MMPVMSNKPAKQPIEYRRRYQPLKVAQLARAATMPAIAGVGKHLGVLLMDWPLIVGQQLSIQCRPRRLQFPQSNGDNYAAGGKLHLSACPGFAMELQYMTPILIDKINAHVGYGLVKSISIDSKLPIPQNVPIEENSNYWVPPPANVDEALQRLRNAVKLSQQ